MSSPRKIDRPTVLEIDIPGENVVLGISDIKDALEMFRILDDNGYQVTISRVKPNKEKKDEQVPDSNDCS